MFKYDNNKRFFKTNSVLNTISFYFADVSPHTNVLFHESSSSLRGETWSSLGGAIELLCSSIDESARRVGLRPA